MQIAGFALAAALALIAFLVWRHSQMLRRAEFIRTYEWPPQLLDKLQRKHPGFSRKETALVSKGLRQFFNAYLKSGRQQVSMPSEVVDQLWHEFILYTQAYKDFCRKAFGGFLHHTPAVMLAPERRASNAGLRRVWWHCCKDENIDPRNPTRLPLLFALDSKLNIAGGYRYVAIAPASGAMAAPERRNAAATSRHPAWMAPPTASAIAPAARPVTVAEAMAVVTAEAEAGAAGAVVTETTARRPTT